MITEKAEYNGDFKGLSPDGYGVMYYKDGSVYRGIGDVVQNRGSVFWSIVWVTNFLENGKGD